MTRPDPAERRALRLDHCERPAGQQHHRGYFGRRGNSECDLLQRPPHQRFNHLEEPDFPLSPGSFTQLQAAITAADIAAAGTATVTVHSPTPGGGISNGLRLDILPGLSSVTVKPPSVAGETASTGTVTLNSPAPTGGAAVSLLSSTTSATFTITTSAVTSSRNVTLRATYRSVTQSTTLTVTP